MFQDIDYLDNFLFYIIFCNFFKLSVTIKDITYFKNLQTIKLTFFKYYTLKLLRA